MCGQSNQPKKVPVCAGSVPFGTNRYWVKSTGPYRCVYKTPGTGTTPVPLAGRYEGRKTPLPYCPKTVGLNDKPVLGMMGKGVSGE